MVGHTHQDFLSNEPIDDVDDVTVHAVDLSRIKDAAHERELFDTSSNYIRKVQLSFLDEHIDDMSDWEKFVRPLAGLNCLYLVDDRTILNPIMRDFADCVNRRYVAMLKKCGIPAMLTKPKSQENTSC